MYTVLKQLIHQICSGLAYLHGRAIAHLDLKPENLIASKLGYEVKKTSATIFKHHQSTWQSSLANLFKVCLKTFFWNMHKGMREYRAIKVQSTHDNACCNAWHLSAITPNYDITPHYANNAHFNDLTFDQVVLQLKWALLRPN